MNRLSISLAIFSAIFFANAQSSKNLKKEYSFLDYPSKVDKNVKAKLKISSNTLGKTFRSQIKKQYEEQNINFGGHYVLTFWGAGMGLIEGAMVDTKTGAIFNIPMTEENSLKDCTFKDIYKDYYKSTSTLFITSKCERTNDENKNKVTYSFYNWNGKTFVFLGKNEKLSASE